MTVVDQQEYKNDRNTRNIQKQTQKIQNIPDGLDDDCEKFKIRNFAYEMYVYP